jgi:PadR family transcriptional regulator AphA
MSSQPELTPVSYLVLGLVARGVRTSYELKQKVAGSIGYFWSFPHSALYAEPARLVSFGLLEEQREDHGRRRRLYTVTPAGREALTAWLREPTAEPSQIRDLGLLKLFFSDGDVGELARAQEAAHRERLVAYESIAAGQSGEPQYPRSRETLRMGLMVERAFVAFWSSLTER